MCVGKLSIGIPKHNKFVFIPQEVEKSIIYCDPKSFSEDILGLSGQAINTSAFEYIVARLAACRIFEKQAGGMTANLSYAQFLSEQGFNVQLSDEYLLKNMPTENKMATSVMFSEEQKAAILAINTPEISMARPKRVMYSGGYGTGKTI